MGPQVACGPSPPLLHAACEATAASGYGCGQSGREQHGRGGVERAQAERGRARGAVGGAVVGGGNWEGQIHIGEFIRKGGRTGGENKTCRFSEAISIDVAVASIFRQRTGILRGSIFFFCSSTFLLFSLGLWRRRWRPDLGNFQRGKRSMLEDSGRAS
ncbi:hypothetical protein PAHAL_7G171100 [Panicum hallii]|uniref:Uncharacterized protein n=1 Tax=Panicum hallii TaxID=206008 RepID=A0A2T8ICL8_9POAL|nr:hypothetical protein PAHAL_7G171100 [Panicum hallii]